MGNTIKLLVERKVVKEGDIYSDKLSIERCEDFHIHWRNLRIIFTKEEFNNFGISFLIAFVKWKLKGSKDAEEDKSLPDYLLNKKINPVHGRRPDDLSIELQGDLPYMPKNMIHIHYKSIRLDVSHREFVELAEAFMEALENFKEWKK